MKIAIGNDHRGVAFKHRLIQLLGQLGHTTVDYGAHDETSCDYPIFAFRVGEAVSSKECDFGLLICGTGLGMCIAANKVPGVRAIPGHDPVTTELGRRHNDANVLCISSELTGEELMERMVQVFLTTEFEGGRHARRVKQICDYEATRLRPTD